MSFLVSSIDCDYSKNYIIDCNRLRLTITTTPCVHGILA